mmetsp:Transcript_12538/g.52736  ORF Transcript_12538/g.52736 Transcript_12538/m.52736 type:complete len:376 (-) Transcript_12538:1251-2378(-)
MPSPPSAPFFPWPRSLRATDAWRRPPWASPLALAKCLRSASSLVLNDRFLTYSTHASAPSASAPSASSPSSPAVPSSSASATALAPAAPPSASAASAARRFAARSLAAVVAPAPLAAPSSPSLGGSPTTPLGTHCRYSGMFLKRRYASALKAPLASAEVSYSTIASARERGSTTRLTGHRLEKSCSSSSSWQSNGRFLTRMAALAPVEGNIAAGSLRSAAASRRSTSTPAARSVALVSATACTSPSARRTAASSPSTSSRSRLVTPRCAADAAATVSERMKSAPLAAATASSPFPAPFRRSSSRCALKVVVLPARAGAAGAPSPPSSPSPPPPARIAPPLARGNAGAMLMSLPWKMAPLSASAARGAHSGIMKST